MNRVLRYLWIVGGAVMSILLFLLASASENSEFFDRNYSWLVGVNILVAAALLVLVVWMLIRLYNRYRRGKVGSKLMTRLVLLFALMGIVPGASSYHDLSNPGSMSASNPHWIPVSNWRNPFSIPHAKT